MLHSSPLLKKARVRQVMLDKWFPLEEGSAHVELRRLFVFWFVWVDCCLFVFLVRLRRAAETPGPASRRPPLAEAALRPARLPLYYVACLLYFLYAAYAVYCVVLCMFGFIVFGLFIVTCSPPRSRFPADAVRGRAPRPLSPVCPAISFLSLLTARFLAHSTISMFLLLASYYRHMFHMQRLPYSPRSRVPADAVRERGALSDPGDWRRKRTVPAPRQWRR